MVRYFFTFLSEVEKYFLNSFRKKKMLRLFVLTMIFGSWVLGGYYGQSSQPLIDAAAEGDAEALSALLLKVIHYTEIYFFVCREP